MNIITKQKITTKVSNKPTKSAGAEAGTGRAEAKESPPEASIRAGDVSLSVETLEALSGVVCDAVRAAMLDVMDVYLAKLDGLLTTAARLSAADTVHTCERAQTVFARALEEAKSIAKIKDEV